MVSGSRKVRGRVTVHPRGFGFVTEEDVDPPRSGFVPPPELNAFLEGDLVDSTFTEGADGRFTASELVLVERERHELYGTVALHRGVMHLRVDREVSNTDWPLDGAGMSLSANDHVLAKVVGNKAVAIHAPSGGDEQALMQVIARHAIPTEFSPEAQRDVAAARNIAHDVGARRDLRDVPTVTIDAPSTRDIDDAIAVLPAPRDGALRLLVSIADVSELVRERTAIDADARDRATSVYLAGRVIPMLPEALSSDWLSLLPGTDRRCLTAELRIDTEGEVTAVDVYESVIRSWARLNYDEVAAFLDRGEVSEAMEPVRAVMPWFRTVSARLGLARARRGGVEVSREEARIVFDPATGVATAVEAMQPTSAHTLIERSMVAANEAIAKWLRERGVPAMYRVHDEPTGDRVTELGEIARNFGFEPGFGPRLSPLALAAFEHQISGMPSEPAIRGVMLRSLGPARYTVHPTQHYGLAAPMYLHFTSPIRRYADLQVHRTIKRYLHGERGFVPDDPEVETLAQHVNRRARSAARAETDRHRMLVARYMSERIGEVFSARVVKVRPFGVVAQIDTTLIEGVIPLESLPDGPYTLDERGGAVVSPTKRVAIGVQLRVRTVACDVSLGRVTFALADETA